MYKTILVPVDVFESDLADNALAHAQYLAEKAGGDIHLLHVLPEFSPMLTRGFIADAKKMQQYLQCASEEKMAQLARSLSFPQNRIHHHIRNGKVRDAVATLADELKADVVVIGSRNPAKQSHLLGSEASGILRHARVSVFVIRL